MIQDNKKNVKRKVFFFLKQTYSLASCDDIEEIMFPYPLKKKKELLPCRLKILNG